MSLKKKFFALDDIRFILYLSGLSILGYLSIDMYLPAFHIMQLDLHSSESIINLSLSIFLFGFSISQIFWGGIADYFGRKFVLLFGLSLFIISCLGMLLVNNWVQLLFLRFVQGVSVCSASVIWQVLVLDHFDKKNSKKIFATIIPLVSLSPALAPLFGSLLLSNDNDCWKIIFFILSIIGMVLFFSTIFLQKSVVFKKGDKSRMNFFQFFKSSFFIGNVLIYSACSAGFFAWLTGSPFILIRMGYNYNDIGVSYIPQTISFMIGGYGIRYLMKKIKITVLLPIILLGYTMGVSLFFVFSFFYYSNLFFILFLFCIVAIMNGACYPIVISNSLSIFHKDIGKASALQNTLQLGLCFFSSLVVSSTSSNPLLATSSVMLGTIIPMFIGYLIQKK